MTAKNRGSRFRTLLGIEPQARGITPEPAPAPPSRNPKSGNALANAIPGETRSKSKPWQRMHDGTLYDGWEVPRPEVNGRSYCSIWSQSESEQQRWKASRDMFHVWRQPMLSKPVFWSTANCCHASHIRRGFGRGEFPRSCRRYSFYLDAHTLNGLSDRPRLWVSLLEELTCIERLHLLTALPWANTLSCVHLLRVNRAWCPYCYGSETPRRGVYMNVYYGLSRLSRSAQTTGGRFIQAVLRATERNMCSRQVPPRLLFAMPMLVGTSTRRRHGWRRL